MRHLAFRSLCASVVPFFTHCLRVSAFLTVFATPGVTLAGTFTVFGPETFERERGKPEPVTRSFSVQDPSASYTIQIVNGDGIPDGRKEDRRERVTDSTIKLNGQKLFGPDDFSKRIKILTKRISLNATNRLDVKIEGDPYSQLIITITGLDSTPPTITASATPLPNEAGWNQTDVAVTFSCIDATSGVDTCSGPALVTTEGSQQVISGMATDKAGNSATTSVTLNIDKTPPSLTISSPSDGAQVTASPLTVSATVIDGLSGVAAATCNGTPAVVSNETVTCRPILAVGSNPIVVQATDIAGNTNTSSITVALLPPNQPPVANSGGPYTANVGTTISFDGSGSTDPDHDTLTYTWDFGDGTTATGPAPTHSYTTTGSFIVAVMVSDGRGGTNTATTTATIGSASALPTVMLSANPTTVRSGTISILRWSSTDATSCTASGGWSGDVETSGDEAIGPLDVTTSYTVTCSGPGGVTAQSVTVSVDSRPRPPDASLVRIHSAEFVELTGRPEHQGLFPVTDEPIVKPGAAQCRIVLLGPVETPTFTLVDAAGVLIQPLSFIPENDSIDGRYLVSTDLPEQPFKIRIMGTDKLGRAFDISSRLFSPRTFGLEFPGRFALASAGGSISVPVTVTNRGEPRTFTVEFSSADPLVLSHSSPTEIYLATGASKEIILSAEMSAATAPFSLLSVRGKISDSGNPDSINSSTFDIRVAPGLSP